jgi:hypothetical protein
MEWTNEMIQNAYLQAKEKAAADPEFAKKLVADPVKAIEELTGLTVPQGYQIRVIEKGGVYDGIFYDEAFYNGELPEEALDTVAGGSCAGNACGANACAGEVNKL